MLCARTQPSNTQSVVNDRNELFLIKHATTSVSFQINWKSYLFYNIPLTQPGVNLITLVIILHNRSLSYTYLLLYFVNLIFITKKQNEQTLVLGLKYTLVSITIPTEFARDCGFQHILFLFVKVYLVRKFCYKMYINSKQIVTPKFDITQYLRLAFFRVIIFGRQGMNKANRSLDIT